MLDRIREARRNESGFTLIELLIVIVILGVLAGIVVFAVSGINDTSKTSACKSDVKNVTIAAEAFYAQNKHYPNKTDDAAADDLAAAKKVLVTGYLHSWPTDTVITYAYTAPVKDASGNITTPSKFDVTGTNGTATC